jgi:serine O-acetyltransferase
MIQNKQDYRYYIERDSRNYRKVSGNMGIKERFLNRLLSSPISDQSKIWEYIKTLRKCEYWYNARTVLGGGKFVYLLYLHKLRKLSRITGFQIPPNTIGPGLTIWHWGPIIVNGNAFIGENCTIRPDVVIGYKDRNGTAQIIGTNVTINSGSRIIGNGIVVGDNVIIAPGAVVTKSIPSNCVVAGIPAIVIKQLKEK